MRYIICALTLCVVACAGLEGAVASMEQHRETLCMAETIGLDDYDSHEQFDECMTRDAN